MDPITAAILVGAITAGIGAYTANEQMKAAEQAQEDAKQQATNNQNALVQQNYAKRKNALGLGGPTSPSGNQASQTGGVLTSVSGLGENSLV